MRLPPTPVYNPKDGYMHGPFGLKVPPHETVSADSTKYSYAFYAPTCKFVRRHCTRRSIQNRTGDCYPLHVGTYAQPRGICLLQKSLPLFTSSTTTYLADNLLSKREVFFYSRVAEHVQLPLRNGRLHGAVSIGVISYLGIVNFSSKFRTFYSFPQPLVTFAAGYVTNI
jgi:hypothetical protein